jgi:hypothetical protein
MKPDEARYSCIPSLMNRTGDYITPHLNHVVYLENLPCATGQQHYHLKYLEKMNFLQGYLLLFAPRDASSSFIA